MDSLVSTEWLEAELGAPDLRVIDATARLKKCSTPANWASTSAIR